MLYIFLTLFAAAIVALDQWTKALAAAQLTDVVDVLIPGWLELRYTTNDGMAWFSTFNVADIFITVPAVLLILYILIFDREFLSDKPKKDASHDDPA